MPTYVAAVGPALKQLGPRLRTLRAVIKGGRVDYGAAHSAKAHGHERYGREFTPDILPDWGEDPAHTRKLHLIGHSQGGQTVRVLSALLANGDAAERQCQR